MNQAPASGTKSPVASAAGWAVLTVNAEYTTAPPRPAATARASAIDLGLGRPTAEKYMASPSRTPAGSQTCPVAATTPAAAVTTPSTGSGQRRSAMTGTQASSRTISCPPAERPPGPATTVSATLPAAAASTTLTSHWPSATPAANQRLASNRESPAARSAVTQRR